MSNETDAGQQPRLTTLPIDQGYGLIHPVSYFQWSLTAGVLNKTPWDSPLAMCDYTCYHDLVVEHEARRRGEENSFVSQKLSSTVLTDHTPPCRTHFTCVLMPELLIPNLFLAELLKFLPASSAT